MFPTSNRIAVSDGVRGGISRFAIAQHGNLVRPLYLVDYIGHARAHC